MNTIFCREFISIISTLSTKFEFKDITKLEIELENEKFMNVLFDHGHDMEERIITEQFNN